MREGYSVTVSKNGEPILTIDRTMLSGLGDLSKEDTDAIRDAGEHLIGFAGPETQVCFACGSTGECAQDCRLGEIEAA